MKKIISIIPIILMYLIIHVLYITSNLLSYMGFMIQQFSLSYLCLTILFYYLKLREWSGFKYPQIFNI